MNKRGTCESAARKEGRAGQEEGGKKALPCGGLPTNKCKINDAISKPPFGSRHAN